MFGQVCPKHCTGHIKKLLTIYKLGMKWGVPEPAILVRKLPGDLRRGWGWGGCPSWVR